MLVVTAIIGFGLVAALFMILAAAVLSSRISSIEAEYPPDEIIRQEQKE